MSNARRPFDLSLPTLVDGPPARGGALRFQAVAKSYTLNGQELPVLSEVDLTVEPGQFLSIVGPSGCGKSTLLRLVVGLDDQYRGRITLDGAPVAGPGVDRGIVFQDHRLLPWMTLAKNVELALINRALPEAEKRELVAEHLALVGLQGFEQAYPHQLSGGMAQRAAIARALVNDPKVLLLDEPFGALDALTRVRLQNELQRIWLRSRSTVIMVTHDVEEAVYLADVVVVMDGKPGRISHRVETHLPRPRDRSAPALRAIEDHILSILLGDTSEGRGAPAAVSEPRGLAAASLAAAKA
jgi:NitT/TauT family transport system ATP-binding protein/sulfonate transport system ATP-binding protein